MSILIAILILFGVYIVGWHQLYGQFIHPFYKRWEIYLIFLSVPSTYLSIYATKLIQDYFNGKMWPIRIITFSIGICMFYILTTIYFQERVTTKTLSLMGLSAVIIILQVFWKE